MSEHPTPKPDIPLSDAAAAALGNEAPEAEKVTHSTPEERIAALETEKKQLHERMLRIAAEFDNWKKRARKDQSDGEARAKESVLKDTIEVVDNLERAVASITETTSVAAITQGVALVLRFIQGKLDRHDVKPIESKGKPFDPRLHEAIGRVVTSEVSPGAVATERQKGYTMGDRLLRPALVEVAVAPAPSNGESQGDDKPAGD